MSVIRAARSAEGRYVQIRNGALQDNRLSLRARGLMAYLLSLPPSTRVNSTELAKEVPEGRDAIRTALDELESYGYLMRTQERTSKGTFRQESVVCDDPALLADEGPGPGNPAPENPPETPSPAPGNPTSDNQAPKDKDEVPKEPPTEAEPTANQRTNKIARQFCDRWPLYEFHGVRTAVSRAVAAQYDDDRIIRALVAIASDNRPVTLGTLRWQLTGGWQAEQRPRTYDDPGTQIASNGLEVLW